jgi:hypothetical protein
VRALAILRGCPKLPRARNVKRLIGTPVSESELEGLSALVGVQVARGEDGMALLKFPSGGPPRGLPACYGLPPVRAC